MKPKRRFFLSHDPVSLAKRQRGVSVLVIVSMLAFLVGIVAAIVTRSGVQESAISGNDIRAREAHEAAQAGLEYALAWAGSTPVTANKTCPGDAACPALAPMVGGTSGESYALTLQFIFRSGGLFKLRSTATSTGNGRASVEAWTRQVSLLKGAFPPPLVINGGLDIVLGNPVIDTGAPATTSIVTSGPVADVNTGHFNKTSTQPLGAVQQLVFPASTTPAWDLVFKTPLSQAIGIAQAAGSVYPAPPAVKTQFYYWNSSDRINANYGSLQRPVVIIIPAPYCPNINGGVVIYGIVYFSQECSDQGWGNADIYGSVLAEGSVRKLNSNTIFHGLGTVLGGMDGAVLFLDYAVVIPGSWKDF